MKKIFSAYTFFVIGLLVVTSSVMANHHFYRSGNYQSETRHDKDLLTSLDLSITGGSTKTGRSGFGRKTSILNIYGFQDFSRAFRGVPSPANLTIAQSDIVQDLDFNDLNNKKITYGKIHYTGKFKHVGFEFNLTQNLYHGFFAQLTVPFDRNSITDVASLDLTTPDTEWSNFINNYTEILLAYGIRAGNKKETRVGDTVISAGWAYNNDALPFVDFFDATLKAGISIPTGGQKDIREAFSFSNSNDGHVGLPVSVDMAVGFLDRFTFGSHAGGQFFLSRYGTFRMKTHSTHVGFIKLAKGPAEKQLGALWSLGTFIKADRIYKKLSLMLGYSFTAQRKTTLTPFETETFKINTVNNDESLKNSRMHTINFNAEYDYSEEGTNLKPKIAVSYNHPVAGKRIFNTKTFGGNAGLNITWKF